MENAMTPSRVLEEYDILNDDISLELIEEMREKFAELEMEGVHVWKMLCDEVTLPEELEKMEHVERKIAEDRAWVAGACAEVMLEKKSPQKTFDHITWRERLDGLKIKEDYEKFFGLLGIDASHWRSSHWLSLEGYGSLVDIIKNGNRFNGWSDFLKFMQAQSATWVHKVAECETRDDFLDLFGANNLDGTIWVSSNRLKNAGHRALYIAIIKDGRFKSWSDFLAFMNIEQSEIWADKIARCETRDDFLLLFAESGLSEDCWSNSKWLNRNGYSGITRALVKLGIFKSWSDYLSFMQVKPKSWMQKVRRCETPYDYLTLFRESGISADQWQDAVWLRQNGYHGLQAAIVRTHFSFWAEFLTFMGVDYEDAWTKKVSECSSKEDFLDLFQKENIPLAHWQSSAWLIQNNSGGLVSAVRKDERFGSWISFLEFMGIQQVPTYVEQVLEAKCHEDFLRLFESVNISHAEWRISSWLRKNGYEGLQAAISRDPRFTSWKHFIACMDGKLPFDGIQSQEEAIQYLNQEIFMLRKKKDWIYKRDETDPISEEEYNHILRPEFYQKNVVVKVVADSLNNDEA